MSDWQKMPISDLAQDGEKGVAGGPFGSSLGRKHYVAHGVPVIRGAQLAGDQQFSSDDLVFVSEEKADSHLGNLAYPGDVLVTQRGTLGQVGRIPKSSPYERFLLSQSQMKVTVDPEIADGEYLYFLLSSPGVSRQLADRAVTTGVPHINLSTLRKFEVSVPNVRIQRRIAAVLSSFDDLIKLNKRRIELLSDVARSLYREWFVRFRFPGFENTEFVESELGEIPLNWKVQTVADVFCPIGGGTPSKKDDTYWAEGTIPWFTPSDLTQNRSCYVSMSKDSITALGLAKSSARLFPAGSVLMTSRATLGVLAIASRESTCNQGFIVIPPVDGVPPSFIREWLDLNKDALEMIATGATFKEITKGAFKRFRVPLPDQKTLRRFGEVTDSSEREIFTREAQNRVLAATRDLLLPRLVNGRLDIASLDLDSLLSLDEAA